MSTTFATRPRRWPTERQLSESLDRDWSRLRRRPGALRAIRRWRLSTTPVSDLDDLLVATGYRRRTSTPAENELLHRLLDRARTDDLAARIVLQRMLPGLLADVRRRGRHSSGCRGLFEELLANAWIAIRVTYVAEGSEHVAATLVRDACHRTFVAPKRRRSADEVAVDPLMFVDEPDETEATPLEELAAIVAEARHHGLDATDVQLVRDLMRVEAPTKLAAERQITTRTVRNHRDRAVYSIRRLSEPAPFEPAA